MSTDEKFIENDLKARFQEIFKLVPASSDLDPLLRQLQMTVIAMARKIEELRGSRGA